MTFHPRDRLPWNRSMSRRDALRLLAGTAVAGGLLVGCGSGGGSSPSAARLAIGTRENPVQQPLYDDNKAIESGLEPEDEPLRLYNWADYKHSPSAMISSRRRRSCSFQVRAVSMLLL